MKAEIQHMSDIIPKRIKCAGIKIEENKPT
jgi:hypothetical protein